MRFEEINKNMNKKSSRRFKKFPSGQGIYIAILICLGVVGATTFFSLNAGGQDQTPTATQQIDTEAQYIPGGGMDEQVGQGITPQISTSPSATTKPSQSPTTTQQSITLTVPVKGDIVVDYHVDELVYSKTLNEWSTHKGIDIAAKTGTEVKAALGGTVEKVEKDAQLGFMVVIAHANSQKTVYANLESLPELKVGDTVKAGDVIGKVGTSAISESEETAHLHFEYWQGKNSVDPKKYMKGIKSAE